MRTYGRENQEESRLTAASYEEYRSVKHFANLDGLRFLCIAMVLWHHAIPVNLPSIKLEGRGFLGVDLFFILSGYLITTLLVREADAFGSFSLRDFYVRRAIRIMPVYYFVVSSVAFYYIVIDGKSDYLTLLPYYYLFLSNFLVDDIPTLGPTWSLSVEEQYYLVWPALLVMLPRRLVFLVLTIFIFGNVMIMTGWFRTPEPMSVGPLVFQMPNATYAPILLGSLAALVLHNRAAFQKISPTLSHGAAAPVVFFLLVVAMEFSPSDLRGIPNFLIHSLMALLLIALVVKERNVFTPILTNRLIARVGVVSYGIYIYHLLALDITNRTFAIIGRSSSWQNLFLYALLSYTLAEISYRTLEAYFRRFRPKPRSNLNQE